MREEEMLTSHHSSDQYLVPLHIKNLITWTMLVHMGCHTPKIAPIPSWTAPYHC